ncbi:FHA domain-containing protein [Nannocystis sp.]|uniref:FHA domain-containing protein n=1 Tax=Nannocystis sp. TaxID=1962667 RepID=UPI002429BE22|nr:FHA domain-containing protein [Nannocystis sp.]MBK7824729.1 DUF4388 domain-containing protein [Nannocystis sp.]MBK9753020.1 DUF4388 domain-containing protein [Nannocystis sp.]
MSAEIHVLKFLTGKYKGEEFPLGPDGGHFIAGRSSEADLVLADDAVSRKHARFYIERRRTWVRDLCSRNGTLVNGTPVKRHCLRPGDRISIGASLMSVQLAKPSQVSAAPRAGEKKQSRARPNVDFSNRSMAGSIEEIPLAGVLQFLAASRKSGNLQVRDGETNRVGRVSMRDGFIVNASIEGSAPGLRPEKAVTRMLGWVKGTFSLDNATTEASDDRVVASIEHVLMESARQQDEIVHLSERTPVPRYSQEVALVQPAPVRWRTLPPEQLDIVQDLAEGRGWAFILDTYNGDDLELTRLIVELRKKRVIEYE